MQLIEDAKSRLVEGAWQRMSLLKKVHLVLEYYCSREAGLQWMRYRDNRHTDFVTYKPNRFLFVAACKIEFKLRNIVYPRKDK